MKFFKYQSLGNDFILLDWMECDAQAINPNWIKENCDRQNGIGADGMLILKNKTPEILMFNSDGTDGQKCLNGLRCAAHYLVAQKKFPQKFMITMQNPMHCEVCENLVTINIGKADYQKPHEIRVGGKILRGHIVDVGNPHFVVLKKIDLAWLQKYGRKIANHADFPARTNVEFVWGDKNNYNALVYERGCGITKACGTGAAAIMKTLHQQNKIVPTQKIFIQMPGGTLQSYLDNDESITQIAPAMRIKIP